MSIKCRLVRTSRKNGQEVKWRAVRATCNRAVLLRGVEAAERANYAAVAFVRRFWQSIRLVATRAGADVSCWRTAVRQKIACVALGLGQSHLDATTCCFSLLQRKYRSRLLWNIYLRRSPINRAPPSFIAYDFFVVYTSFHHGHQHSKISVISCYPVC